MWMPFSSNDNELLYHNPLYDRFLSCDLGCNNYGAILPMYSHLLCTIWPNLQEKWGRDWPSTRGRRRKCRGPTSL